MRIAEISWSYWNHLKSTEAVEYRWKHWSHWSNKNSPKSVEVTAVIGNHLIFLLLKPFWVIEVSWSQLNKIYITRSKSKISWNQLKSVVFIIKKVYLCMIISIAKIFGIYGISWPAFMIIWNSEMNQIL